MFYFENLFPQGATRNSHRLGVSGSLMGMGDQMKAPLASVLSSEDWHDLANNR